MSDLSQTHWIFSLISSWPCCLLAALEGGHWTLEFLGDFLLVDEGPDTGQRRRDLYSGCVCAGQHPSLNRHVCVYAQNVRESN